MNLLANSRRLQLTCLCLSLVICACGTMAPPADTAPPQPEAPQPGPWSLLYTGDCAGRESEAIRITELDDNAIRFDDYHLLRDESGEYRGSANFIASMPVDGREIGYVITYALSANDTGGFSGTQTVVEGGGHGLDCPVELAFGSAD